MLFKKVSEPFTISSLSGNTTHVRYQHFAVRMQIPRFEIVNRCLRILKGISHLHPKLPNSTQGMPPKNCQCAVLILRSENRVRTVVTQKFCPPFTARANSQNIRQLQKPNLGHKNCRYSCSSENHAQSIR